jgi:hypothetical protein
VKRQDDKLKLKLVLQSKVKDLLIYGYFPTPFNFCYNNINGN